MEYKLKQVSSLHKIRDEKIFDATDVNEAIVLAGEEFSYQIAVCTDVPRCIRAELVSPIADNVTLYFVRKAMIDMAVYPRHDQHDDVLLTREDGVMPDILMPLAAQNNTMRVPYNPESVWVRVRTTDLAPGTYPITVRFKTEVHIFQEIGKDYEAEITFNLTVLSEKMPKQQTMFTQWFHTDCIATAHNVEVYSEAHWDLIDRYMKMAADVGINMILTPVLTPPLDTSIGVERVCVQLTEITKEGDKFAFDFDKLRRFIGLLDKNGIEGIEICHLFTQWGLRNAPNIYVTENGEYKRLFGWDTDGQGETYKNFLVQFLPALVAFLKEEGVFARCRFHVSDEPNEDSLARYEYASGLVRSLIDGAPITDALSHLEFYENGYTDLPVCGINKLESFLEKSLENQWTYYCCSDRAYRSNRFLAMPSYRNRIIGLQLYKFNVKGFLHWGYNYYNEQGSRYPIDPYNTTSSERAFPSGDPFSVYPHPTLGVIPSLRAVVFKEALQDIEVCRTLEKYIGREAVIAMMDEMAGAPITLDNYPRCDDYILNLMQVMKAKIAEFEA